MDIKYWISLFSALQMVLHTALLIILLRAFYDSDFHWNGKKAIILGATGLIYFLSLIFRLDIITIILTIVLVIIPVYDYSGKKIVGLFRFICAETLVILCTSVVSLIAVPYFIPNYDPAAGELTLAEELFYNIFLAIYFGVLFLVLYFGVHKRNIVVHRGKPIRIFNILYFLVLILLSGLMLNVDKHSPTALIVLAASFMVAFLILPVFVFSLRISAYYQQRTKLQEAYMQSELEHFRQYMHAQEETRRFRHDIRNNLLCMNEMVTAGDNEKVAQYLKDLLEITESLSFKYVTGDELLDSILNSKAQDMDREDIRLEVDGVLAGGLPWKPVDICAVFANALDNAVEACLKVERSQRRISVDIKSTPQFWFITIANTVEETVDTTKLFHKKGGYTSKSDPSKHGIGTYSIKQTAESYGAVVKAECLDHIFKLEIMIDRNH